MRKSSACSILFGLFVWDGTFHSVESFVGPGRRHPTVCSSWTATRSSAPRTLAAAAEADAEAASDVSIPYDAAARLAFEALGDDTLAFEDYIKTYKAEAIEFVKSKGFFASSSSSSSPLSSSFSVDAVTDASASSDSSATATTAPTTITIQEEQKRMREEQKRKLLSLIGATTGNTNNGTKNSNIARMKTRVCKDPVLADPMTKEGMRITYDEKKDKFKMTASSSSAAGNGDDTTTTTRYYEGSTKTWLNLLEPVVVDSNSKNDKNSERKNSVPPSPASIFKVVLRQATPFIPPNLRGQVSTAVATLLGDETFETMEYVPMRDLFTNPQVSFAYERGWRQQFQASGFPGPDKEAQLAQDYFAKPAAAVKHNVLVDMSCATGLFTRRFAASGHYDRVLGCDYSASMLTEARRRINANENQLLTTLTKNKTQSDKKSTALELVQLDVGQIPMQTNSIDCFHAGAAMHCWPDLDAAAAEIYRVLKPNGGRYFATTFLSTFFKNVAALDRSANNDISQQAFQYFDSVDVLRDILIGGGFEDEKISIEVLGAACVVIRAEK